MQRRHLTTAITLLLLCGILVLGLVVGYRSLFRPIDDKPAAQPCTHQLKKGQRIRSSEVEVSVYNRGTRTGLAAETMSRLARRGFERGEIGNAPRSAKVSRVQIWTTDRRDDAARLVARQFGARAKVFVKQRDLGPGIDVIVGTNFAGFSPPVRTIKARSPQSVCASSTPSA